MAYVAMVVGGSRAMKEQGCLASCELIGGDLYTGKLYINQCAPMRHTRRAAAVTSLQNRIIAIGGCSGLKQHLASIENFDISLHRWEMQQLTGHIVEASCSALCTNNDAAFIVGGFNADGCLRNVQKFKLELNERQNEVICEQLQPLNFCLKNATSMIMDDNIYLFGGWNDHQTLDTIFKYNVKSENTQFYAHMPYSIECHSMVSVGEIVYIFGGFDGISLTDRIIRYNVNIKTYIELAVHLDCKKECTAGTLIYQHGRPFAMVIGGWNGEKSLQDIELFEILEQSPFLRKIDLSLSLSEPRNRPALFFSPNLLEIYFYFV